MNREIKFRAWVIKDKEMYSVEEISWDNEGNLHGLLNDNNKNGRVWFENNECILMQSTGLTDKNGKEIYEGDILSWISSNPFSLGETKKVKVYYIEAHFWCNSNKFGVYLGQLLSEEKCKIIGSIYENPELINS